MQTVLWVILGTVGGFALLMVVMNVVIRRRARAMEGQPLPPVPGPIGDSLSRAGRGLVYFFSPQCGACRSITPRMQALSDRSDHVHVVDVTQHLDVARALRVLATPSTIEVAQGRVVGVHIGMIPREVEERFAS